MIYDGSPEENLGAVFACCWMSSSTICIRFRRLPGCAARSSISLLFPETENIIEPEQIQERQKDKTRVVLKTEEGQRNNGI